MIKGKLATSTLVLVLTAYAPASSDAADAGVRMRAHYRHVWHHRRIVLPPERHVVEVNRPVGSPYFIINGTSFTAMTPQCIRWVAGERIKLVAGDWNGSCHSAVFYNARRHQTCEMLCN